MVPVDGVYVDGATFYAPGYWLSTEAIALYEETGKGCEKKLRVVESVKVQQGLGTLDVVMIAGSALVVGVAGGIVLGITLD